MDLDDIKRRAAAARDRSCEVAPGVNITLRVPTQHQVNLCAAKAGVHAQAADPGAALLAMQRALLETSVVAWDQGVKLSHILQDQPAEVLPFQADAVPLLLDAQPEWAHTLGARLNAELTARQALRDTAAKN
jgi:hypothetical protein